MSINNTADTIVEYTQEQKKEIAEGIMLGLDTTLYNDPQLLAIQMREIKLGLQSGVDVSIYAKPEFDPFQMAEIREGLVSNVDVSLYADPSVQHIKMRHVRIGLENGVDISGYLEYDAGILRELYLSKLSGVFITPFIEEGYDAEQIEQIRLAYEHNVDIQPFLSTSYCGVSIEEIRIGLEKNLDVSFYAKPCYNWRQMREIRYGLEAHIDVLPYTNPMYSYRQMAEIRKGLEIGLPVGAYGKLRYSASDMRRMRAKLVVELHSSHNNLQASRTKVEEMTGNSAQDGEKNPFKIMITPDGMEVHLIITDKDQGFTEEMVLRALWKSKVRKGILRREILKAVDGTYRERSVLIACGQAPRSGKDGWYEYFFNTNISRKPKVLEDGSVDYQNIEWFDTVKPDDKLALYHPAEYGTDGYTVRGEALPAIKGKEQPVLLGFGFKIEPDERTYTSTVHGWVELKESRLEVSNMLVVEKASVSTGNIIFDGSVHVKGNVGNQALIRASGDIIIDGFAEAATIESGGSIMFRQGMNAGGKGSVIAANNVSGKFLEGVKVRAGGNIEVNYCLHSDIEAGGRIEISKYSGSLLGGRSCAVKGILAQNVGNRLGINTYLKAGVNEDMLMKVKALQDDIKSVRDELSILESTRIDVKNRLPKEIYKTQEVYLKIERAIYAKKRQLDELDRQKAELDEIIETIHGAKIVIQGKLYEGTLIELNGKRWNSRIMRDVTIRVAMNEEIVVFKN